MQFSRFRLETSASRFSLFHQLYVTKDHVLHSSSLGSLVRNSSILIAVPIYLMEKLGSRLEVRYNLFSSVIVLPVQMQYRSGVALHLSSPICDRKND